MHAQILAACRAAADLPPIHVECQRVRLASKCLHRLPDLHMAAPLLRELDLSRNAFALFPAQLWELQSLEVLNLAHNQISVIEAAARRMLALLRTNAMRIERAKVSPPHPPHPHPNQNPNP